MRVGRGDPASTRRALGGRARWRARRREAYSGAGMPGVRAPGATRWGWEAGVGWLRRGGRGEDEVGEDEEGEAMGLGVREEGEVWRRREGEEGCRVRRGERVGGGRGGRRERARGGGRGRGGKGGMEGRGKGEKRKGVGGKGKGKEGRITVRGVY